MINLASANTYTYALAFSGVYTKYFIPVIGGSPIYPSPDAITYGEYYPAPLACSKLVVTKKPITITAKDQTFKVSEKTKTVTVKLSTSKSLYDGKIYLSAGKKVTLKVDGKTYTGTINNNGKVSFNVQINKKGTFNAVISFDGDKTYDSATKTIKIKIN